jgi:DNA ligase 1
MKDFTDLYAALDSTTKTNEKIEALRQYFQNAAPADSAWAIYFLTGRKPKQLIQAPKVVAWAIESAEIPEWLFAESYDAVGDLAETIALLLPNAETTATQSLTYWVEQRLLPLKGMREDLQKEAMLAAWNELDEAQRFIWNKLITGAFRVGVSQQLVIRALALVIGIEPAVVAHRLMGNWEPTAEFYIDLTKVDTGAAALSRPYPFYLAYPFEGDPQSLGTVEEWQCEWKWDGIRCQLIKREGQSFLWSRGEDLITERFPELVQMAEGLPDGTVIDGEILPWKEANVLPFNQLQHRIGRKTLSKKMLADIPVILMSYDLLELNGQDIRELPLFKRRELLTKLACGISIVASDYGIKEAGIATPPLFTEKKHSLIHAAEQLHLPFIERQPLVNESVELNEQTDRQGDRECDRGVDHEVGRVYATCQRLDTRLRLSPLVIASSWNELLEKRKDARALNVEGLMLKRLTSPYKVGRQRGDWWKWKVNPYTIDAVLIHAQRGSGKRASLYTDYTFGVWDGDALVPVAKAYSGLTDSEIQQVDAFVRQNTIDKFGPVRTVKPFLVFELGFEGIQKSARHKAGVAVRFPRMLRWRQDKPAAEADSLDTLKQLLSS